MNREELLKSPVYWTSLIQDELYRQIENYMKEKEMNKAQLAEHLSCSRGYITQLLNGEYDHKLSKLVELSLAIGKAPVVKFEDIESIDEKFVFSGCSMISFTPNITFSTITDSEESKIA